MVSGTTGSGVEVSSQGSNTARILASASQQPENVVQSRPFDEEATSKAVKGNALLAAAAAGDGEGVALAAALAGWLRAPTPAPPRRMA